MDYLTPWKDQEIEKGLTVSWVEKLNGMVPGESKANRGAPEGDELASPALSRSQNPGHSLCMCPL